MPRGQKRNSESVAKSSALAATLKRHRPSFEWQVSVCESDHNPNAVLFIFETIRPQKHLLRIVPKLQPSNCNLYSFELELTTIQDLLNEIVPLPQDGRLSAFRRSQKDILVLLWTFEVYTRCSEATNLDFDTVQRSESYWTNPKSNGAVFWPFFTLKFDDKPTSSGTKYPRTSEGNRIQALYKSLQNKPMDKYNVFHWARASELNCRFSGGGDLCIQKTIKPLYVEPLIVITNRDSEEQSSEVQPADETASLDSSPPTPGAARLATFIVEGKKDDPNPKKKDSDKLDYLRWQLWANMVLVGVETFVDKIDDMKIEDLMDITELNVYGLALTGDGTIGVFKLLYGFCADEKVAGEIKINKEGTIFVEKVELATRDRKDASQLADFTLSHYLE